ncbi:MAG: efflux RND transporter permease subunit [Oligoflexia bacterium]
MSSSMTLSEISIRRPVFAWMLMAALMLFGWISFKRMGISQLPDVDFPVLNISVGYEGAAPEVLESEVVDPIEDSVMTVQGIRNVSSSSRYGSASITLEFDLDRNIDTALQEVQTKIAQAQRLLPREIDPPVITKTNPEDQPILWLTVSSNTGPQAVPTRELMRYVRDQLKDRFSTLPGVGEVFLGGYIDPNIRLWATSDKLAKYELSVGDILSTIRQEHTELPAGQLETERREYDVRTLGEAETVEQLSRIGISERGGRPSFRSIPLKNVVRIEEGLAEARRLSRFNQKPAIGLGIRKQRGANAVAVAKAVRNQMAKLMDKQSGQLPPGVELNLNFDTTQFIEESVHELNFTLILSAILTGIVCWFFLGSWSSTINVLLAIPTSIIGTFTVLHFMGFTLNTFTLLGLSLAIGIVVDDAIMVLENIVRHSEMGKSRLKAALEGSAEITFAAIAATVAIAAIFLPVVFMKGAIGRFFFQFGVTLTVAVFLSLLEALTLTPMRCSQFLDHSSGGRLVDRLFVRWEHLYRLGLSVALQHRWKVVGGALIFMVASFATARALRKEFVPAQDQGRFMMRLQTPVDSSLQYTDGKFKEAEALLATRPEVLRYYVAVGGFGGGEVNTGVLFVTLQPKGKRGKNPATGKEWTQQELMEDLKSMLKQVKDTKVFAQDLSMRGFSASRGYPLEFSVRGSDWGILAQSAEKIREELEKTGLVSDLDWDYKLGKPEIQIYPDRERAAQRGVSVRAISEAIQALVGGVNVGKYSSGGHRYDIRVRLEPEERTRAEQIRRIQVRNNRGELLPLAEVVQITEKPALSQINRYNRERAISLFANIPKGKSQSDAIAAVQAISARLLPFGYKTVMSGSSETFKESFADLGFALLLGVAVAYMVLASQFNSFIDPLSVLLSMPFSISGAFLGLWLTGQSLNIYSFIGLILLMGIVKKNSILLVDFTNQAIEAFRKQSQAPLEAGVVHRSLLEACPNRLRPILMTSFSTVAGALPPALALGPGSETLRPMAVTVIGGVIVSTLLTLFVVPCAYSLFARWQRSKGLTSHLAVLLLFILAPLQSIQPAAAEASPINLKQAIQEALENQPQVKQARERLVQFEADEGRAFATLFPVINANLSAMTRKDAVVSNFVRFNGEPYNSYSANIQAQQPLLVFGFFSGIHLTRTDRELRQLDLEIASRDLSINVIRAFYQVLLSQRLLETLTEIEKIQKETLATALRRQSIGRGQLLDVLQARTQLALLEPRLAQVRTQRRIAAQELATLLGRTDPQVITVTGSLETRGARQPGEPRPLSELEKELISSEIIALPELQQVRLRRQRVSQARSVTIGQNFPSIRATGELARQSFVRTDLLSNSANAWSASINLTIPLFSGLSILQEIRSFNAQAAQVEAEEHGLIQSSALERVRSQQTLEMTRTNLESSQRAWDLSKQSLEEARRNYRLATIDLLQLLQVQQAFQDAQQSLEQARFDHLQALARTCRAVGIPVSRLVGAL